MANRYPTKYSGAALRQETGYKVTRNKGKRGGGVVSPSYPAKGGNRAIGAHQNMGAALEAAMGREPQRPKANSRSTRRGAQMRKQKRG